MDPCTPLNLRYNQAQADRRGLESVEKRQIGEAENPLRKGQLGEAGNPLRIGQPGNPVI